jgi:hypothetical protein
LLGKVEDRVHGGDGVVGAARRAPYRQVQLHDVVAAHLRHRQVAEGRIDEQLRSFCHNLAKSQ